MMKRTLLILLILGGAVLLWRGTAPQPGSSVPTDERIAWVGAGLPAALEQASETGQPVMVDFYADWCGPCKMLDERTYTDGRIVNAATNWVSVKVDVDEHQDLARQYNVSTIPTIVFIAPGGEELSRFSGFVPPQAMLQQMEKARSLMPAS